MLRAKNIRRLQSTIAYNRSGEQVAVAPKAIQQTSTLSNGVHISSLETHGPQASVAVYLNSGSRHEFSNAPGAAHLFNRSVIRTVKDSDVVNTILSTEIRGNSLYSEVGREHIIVGSEFLRDDVVDVVPELVTNTFNPAFEVYELLRAQEATGKQSAVANSDPVTRTVEKLHQVAFRRGLGNSLYASEHTVKDLTRKDVLSVAAVSPNDVAIVGTGVSHSYLKELAEKAFGNIKFGNKKEVKKTLYYGGEARIEGSNSEAVMAVAYPGASYANIGCAAASILCALLQGESKVAWGTPKIGTSSTKVTGLNASYSDAGLVGFVVTGKTSEIQSAASKALNILQTASNISASAFESAKKSAILAAEDTSRSSILAGLGKLAISGANFEADVDGIANVTHADFKKFATSLAAGKASVVTYGNLAALPYFDEL